MKCVYIYMAIYIYGYIYIWIYIYILIYIYIYIHIYIWIYIYVCVCVHICTWCKRQCFFPSNPHQGHVRALLRRVGVPKSGTPGVGRAPTGNVSVPSRDFYTSSYGISKEFSRSSWFLWNLWRFNGISWDLFQGGSGFNLSPNMIVNRLLLREHLQEPMTLNDFLPKIYGISCSFCLKVILGGRCPMKIWLNLWKLSFNQPIGRIKKK